MTEDNATRESAGRNLFEVVSRRRVVAITTFALGVLLAAAIAIVIKPYYVGTAHVLLVNDQQGRDPTSEGVDLPTIATSTTVLERVRDQLHLRMPLERLTKNVTVKVAPKSSIMTITAKDHSPSRAVAITNAVADTFTSFYSSVSGVRYRNVIDQLRHDLTARRTHIMALESQLQRAASTSSYVGSQTSLDNTANSLNELVTQRTYAYAQYVSDKAQLDSTRQQPGQLSKIIRHETLANDQNYHELEIEVSHDVANLAVRKASNTDLFPGMIGAEAKVASENATLRKSAEQAIDGPAAYSPSLGGQIIAEQKAAAAVAGDEARVKALDAQIGQTRGELRRTPADGAPNAGAVRALRDAEEAQYQALALRLSNAQANSAEANSLGSVAVIDRADIAEPSLLGPNLLLALGLCVALALAIAAAYFAESLDPRFITPTDVESVYGRPVLGSLNSK
jgi:capsular polysaccharide biosynthesis protein